MTLYFNEPLARGSAANVANYTVHLLKQGRRLAYGLRQTKIGKAVGASSVEVASDGQSILLTFSSRLHAGQMFQLRINGGQGGLTDTSGAALNSPSQGASGSDYVYNGK